MVVVVGLSFHNTPLEVRERAAFANRELAAVLDQVQAAGVRESVVVSTCNRTEFYLAGADAGAVSTVVSLLSARIGEDASRYVIVRREREAVAHLFRVTAGLDSMVLGETQIAGQVRDAWETARGHSSTILNRLFQTAARVSSRVREETQISRGAASVSSAAVQLGKQIFGSLIGVRTMVLGAGEMADLALKCLIAEGVTTALVVSRSEASASEMALRHGAVSVALEEMWGAIAEIDLLMTGTSAATPVVTRERLQPTLRARGDRPLCILDIAVPRDVAPDVARIDNVFLYDIDDLKAVVTSNLQRRRAEIPAAERIVADETDRYWNWLGGLSAVPTLAEFRAQMEKIRERELSQAMRKLGHLSDEQRAAFDHFSRALMNKFLHEPSVKLREAAAQDGGLETVDAVRYLFGLPGSEDESTAAREDDSPRKVRK